MTRDAPRPFWQEAVLLALPILLVEACTGVREHLRRAHKARQKADPAPARKGSDHDPSR